MNSKEENSSNFCPKYVQEFGPRLRRICSSYFRGWQNYEETVATRVQNIVHPLCHT
jgi:hypothetical protein